MDDLPGSESRKFIYADNICCAVQAQSFADLEKGLNSDMARLSEFCDKWRLTPVSQKQYPVCFT